VQKEIDKNPKLKKSITQVKYYRNWIYFYHKSHIDSNRKEFTYRLAVFDKDYKDCSLELPHKGKVIIVKEGTLSECVKEVASDWRL